TLTPLAQAIKQHNRQLANEIFYSTRIPFREVPDLDINVDKTNVMSHGAFGVVYKGKFDGQDAAIEISHRPQVGYLNNQIEILKQCPSPYLVQPLAVANLGTDDIKLALEFMDCGSLHKYLYDKRNGIPTKLDVSNFDIAWVIACGLADLHHNNVLHRDIKSPNVLLSTKHYIKITDLACSRVYDTEMTTGVGTLFWSAPEVFSLDGVYDYACDIYSLGVVLSELSTLQPPYADLNTKSYQLLNPIREGSLRPRVSESCEPWLRDLAERCLAFDPQQRPTAIQVIDFLRQVATDH
ncbi:kinase, partial [Thraustotheca clavata]